MIKLKMPTSGHKNSDVYIYEIGVFF
jgi:hypothetical protein